MAQTQVDENSSAAGGHFNGSVNMSNASPMKSTAYVSPQKMQRRKFNKSFSHTQRYKTPKPSIRERFQYVNQAEGIQEDQNEYATEKNEPGYMKSTQTRDRKKNFYQPVMEL